METTKPWYLSRTVWASLITVLSAGGAIFGLPVDGLNDGSLAELLLQAITAISGIVALFGRVTATSRIG